MFQRGTLDTKEVPMLGGVPKRFPMRVSALLLLLAPHALLSVRLARMHTFLAYFVLAQKLMLITWNKIPKFHSFFLKTSVDEKR